MPLQQMDMLAAKSWLVGTTNQIVTQQRECRYDLLVNVRLPVCSRSFILIARFRRGLGDDEAGEANKSICD